MVSCGRRPAAVAFVVSAALCLVGCAVVPASSSAPPQSFWTGFRDHPHGYLAKAGAPNAAALA
ncbi:hypothetical protein GVN18_40365, partial [Pseudomonas sp. ODNR1LW]|nr:hypothetical protein [Pseudomonas sp. ODNR1LW]